MTKPIVHSGEAVVGPRDLDTEELPERATSLGVRSFGLTDAGRVREQNEDQFLVATLLKSLQVHHTSLPMTDVHRGENGGHIFAVADGIGGGAAGERASALAIDSVESFLLDTFRWFRQLRGSEEQLILADFQAALGRANERVLAEAAGSPELRGMGTTLTLAYCQGNRLFVAHAGDSRCYLFRGLALYRLTRDHTLVEEMVRRGILRAEEAAKHSRRHVIMNAVGAGQSEVRVEVHRLQLEADDRMLLCTDGLTEMVKEEEIAHILAEEAEPETACRRLVARANEEGGKDNITVVLACFDAA